MIQDNLSVADGGALTKSCLTMNCVKSQVPASLSLHSVGVRPIEVEPVIIIIIIITRPKPAYGRQGLANILLRASGAQLRSDEVIDKHTLYHNIYIIIRPKPAYGRQGLAGVLL